MQDFANISHPLKRDGRSQDDRNLTALQPNQNPIDGRDWKELLVFLYKMSKWVKHYQPDGSEFTMTVRDWRAFLQNSTPVKLALIGEFELDQVTQTLADFQKNITQTKSFSAINPLMDYLGEVLFLIADWQQDLVSDKSGFKVFLDNIITSNIKFILVDLIAISNAARKWNYQAPRSLQQLENWGLAMMDYFTVDNSLSQLKISEPKRIALAQQKLLALSQLLLKNLTQIVQKAPQYIQQSLDVTKAHDPHLGLLYAFIKLWKLLQSDLNQLTQKHLDHFYRTVLGIQPKAIIPDKAHLVFELAQRARAEFLPKGFLFKGKDNLGNNLQFALNRQTVIQKAKVTDLRSLYLDLANSKTHCEVVQCAFKAPIANSADGLGADFGGAENPTWKTLGWPESKTLVTPHEKLAPYYQLHPFADFGFLLASQALFLQEGTRTITISLTLDIREVFENNIDKIGTEDTEYGKLKKALEERYYTITEETLKKAKDSGMKAPIIAYFKQYEGQAFTQAQLDNIIENRVPKSDTLPNKDAGFLTGDNNAQLKQTKAFDLCFSGEEEWVMANPEIQLGPAFLETSFIPDELQATESTEIVLSFQTVLQPDAPIITCFNPDVFEVDYETELPVVKINLNPSIKYEGFGLDKISLYHALRCFKIKKAQIEVDVDKVCQLVLQNDNGVLDPTKPVQPFGPIPKVGDNFYIGSAEVFSKNLTCLDLTLAWKDLPTSFATHYEAYYDTDNTAYINHDFIINGLKNNIWNTLSIDDNLLFDYIDNSGDDQKQEDEKTFSITSLEDELGKVTEKKLAPYDFNSLNGFLNLQLEKDFKHDEYAEVLTNKMLLIAKSTKAELEATPIVLPKPPYTPTIQKVSLSYKAKAENKDIQFIHLHPYEKTYEVIGLPLVEVPENMPYLVPKFTNEGHLFMGVTDLEAGSVLDVLVQVDAATANPDIDKAVVEWAYLSDNSWITLRPEFEILSDETNGLIQSGIVQVKIPWDITTENTILPKGLAWIRATVANNVAAIAETVTIQAQAAKVTFIAEGINLERLNTPLPTGTITKSIQSVTTLKKINQPFDAFGGRAPESNTAYYRRVSERLRHKGRGITLFDYETLVLEAFPDIFKAKCITHTLGRKGQSQDYELSPGFVTMAVIPDVSQLKMNNKLEPKATLALLESIANYLKKRISPFIRLRALNPIYEHIHIRAKIKFREGLNESFYQNKLAEDLQTFLAPWAFGGTNRISFGGKVNKSAILNFIEQKEYVDYLTDLKMLNDAGTDHQEIFASTARSILTTGKHEFTPIITDCCSTENGRSPNMQGMGYVAIGSESFEIQ